jgi:hypothetical protein
MKPVTKAPQYYVISTLPVLFVFISKSVSYNA